MAPSSPSSPRNPQRMGFIPINNSRPSETETADIPLTTVRSAASSTGARKPNQGIEETMSNGSDEKQGLFYRAAGRRKLKKELADQGRRGTYGSDEVALNAMGRLYNTIINFSVVTRYMVYVVPVAVILAVPIIVLGLTGNREGIHVGSVFDGEGREIQVGPPLFELFIWIEAAWLSLWAGKMVAHMLPVVFMFFCGVVSSGTKKYATVIRALEIPLSLFFWALASWLVFRFRFSNDAIQWVDIVKKISGALFVSSAVFLGEKTLVQLISITYHQRSFANRIKDSKREVFLLGLLYDASRMLFPMYCPEFVEEDTIINDSIDLMLGGRKGDKKSGSVTPMRLIGNVGANVGRLGDKVTSVFGNVASEITGKQVFNPNSAHSIVIEALEKIKTSEALARRIWMSFVVEGSDVLSQNDVEEVLGPAHKEEAEECFEAIDADQNGDISLDEMIRKVVEISIERKAIANSMKDISQALTVFDEILLFVVLLIVVFIFLAFFQSTFIATLATAGTALLSLSFVFAVTTQEFLGSCIFLFVKHPYDVGDRVDITGSEKEQLIVERISLLYTIFTRIDKMQVVQVPNIVLNNLWIENVTRSKAMKEVIDINCSYDTTFEDIELLRLEMERFVRHPDNSRDFMPDLAIGVAGVGDLDKMQLKIAIKHKSNWHNEAVRASRRSKFICALTLALKRVPIYAPGGGGEPLGGPLNPAYSVAVTDEFAAAGRDKATAEKEGKRMVPNNPGGDKSEKAAANELNTSASAARLAAEGAGANRGDDTLQNSREESLERKRTNDIETIRQELTSKSASQRGRRQAGQAIPPMSLGEGGPRLTLTREVSGGRSATFDIESQTSGAAGYGSSNPYYGGNMTTTAAVAMRQQQQQQQQQQQSQQPQGGYSVFPRQQYSPPSSSSGNFAGLQGAAGAPVSAFASASPSSASPHPLQSAPTGSRSRGASISKSLRGGGGPGQAGPSGQR